MSNIKLLVSDFNGIRNEEIFIFQLNSIIILLHLFLLCLLLRKLLMQLSATFIFCFIKRGQKQKVEK